MEFTPSSTVWDTLSEERIISEARLCACSACSLISPDISACPWIASAVLSVLPAMFSIEVWLLERLVSKVSIISIASPKCFMILSATWIIRSWLSFCFFVRCMISSVFSLLNLIRKPIHLIDAYATRILTKTPTNLVAPPTPLSIIPEM